MSKSEGTTPWFFAPLSDLTRVRYGKSLDKSLRSDTGAFPVVGSAGVMTKTDVPLMNSPCIVVGRKGNVGAVQFFRNGCYPIDTVYYFETPANVDVQFLSLNLEMQELKSLDASTAIPSLRREDLEQIQIPLPPLPEQERIVEILEEQFSRLDTALASIRNVRAKAAAFSRSLLQSAFGGELSLDGTAGWEELTIKEVLSQLPNGKLVGQGWSPQCEPEPSGDDEWGVLKTTAIQAGRFEPEHNKRLPATLEPRPDIEVKPGDLLLTCAGPRKRCGVPCLVRDTRGKLMLSGKMYRFRPDTNQIEPAYLEYYLLSPRAQYDIDDMKTGISDSGLNLTHSRFFRLMVPIAPLTEQRRLVSIIEEQFSRIDNALAIADQLEARFDSERRSMLHAAFAGTLTAQWRESHHG